jgi:hypothetical protein
MSYSSTRKVILAIDSSNMKLTSYKASLQYSDNHCEGDDTIMDVTFIGEGVFDPVNVCGLEFMLKLCILDATFVLEV